jgi:hypothetical protein
MNCIVCMPRSRGSAVGHLSATTPNVLGAPPSPSEKSSAGGGRRANGRSGHPRRHDPAASGLASRLTALLLVALVSSVCSSCTIPRYGLSADNVLGFRKVGQKVNVGPFTASTPGQAEIDCRGKPGRGGRARVRRDGPGVPGGGSGADR